MSANEADKLEYNETAHNTTEQMEVNDTVEQIWNDFSSDLINSFPEFGEVIELNKNMNKDEKMDYIKKIYPERFFDILYQNEEIFNDDNLNTNFFPNLDFKAIWKLDPSEKTKETIWKYLHHNIRFYDSYYSHLPKV